MRRSIRSWCSGPGSRAKNSWGLYFNLTREARACRRAPLFRSRRSRTACGSRPPKTERKTRAAIRSGVTSTRVIVISPESASWNSVRSRRLSSIRMSSATRRVRRPFSGIADLVPGDLGFLEVAGVGEDAAEDLLDDRGVAVDGDDAEPGPLPEIVELELGHGHVVPADPVLEAVQDAALVLQRMGVGKEQVERQDADDHRSLPRRQIGWTFSRTNASMTSPASKLLKPPTPMPHS